MVKLKQDHFTLNSANLEITDRLFKEVLGFSKKDRPAFYFPGLWYSLADIEVHVIGKSYTDGKPVKDLISEEIQHYLPVDHIAFLADDFDYWDRWLTECEIDFRVDDHRPKLELQQIFFHDVGGSEAQFELNFR